MQRKHAHRPSCRVNKKDMQREAADVRSVHKARWQDRDRRTEADLNGSGKHWSEVRVGFLDRMGKLVVVAADRQINSDTHPIQTKLLR